MGDGHTGWCAGGHRCGLGEHRSDPLVVDLGARGRIVAVRVLSRETGTERLEIRHSLLLARGMESRHAARLVEHLAHLVEDTADEVRWPLGRRAA